LAFDKQYAQAVTERMNGGGQSRAVPYFLGLMTSFIPGLEALTINTTALTVPFAVRLNNSSDRACFSAYAGAV